VVNTVGVGYDQTTIDFDDFNIEKTDVHRGEAYNRSKLEMAMFTVELAKRLEGRSAALRCSPAFSTYFHYNMTFFAFHSVYCTQILNWSATKIWVVGFWSAGPPLCDLDFVKIL